MSTSQHRPVLDQSVIEDAVLAATAAPSILNSQPWRFHATADRIDVFLAPERAPNLLDTEGREVHLSVGAALLNLRLALGAAGLAVSVELLPSALDPRVAATVRVVGTSILPREELGLYDAIPSRRSSRLPFTAELVRYEEFDRLQEAAAVEGAHLEVVTGFHRVVVASATRDADALQRADQQLVDEVTLWTVERAAREQVGIPPDSLGPSSRDPRALVRDLAFGRRVGDRETANFEESALIALLLTAGDAPADWLRGGMALERVLLSATARGLSVGLLSQATEVPELRRLVRDPMSAWRHPQMVLRLGYGEQPAPSPRRALTDVLEIG